MVRPTDLLPSVRSGALSGGQRAAACWENRGEREQVGRASWRCGRQGRGADVFQVSVGPFAVVRGPWLQCADHHTARPHHQCWPWAKSSHPTPPPPSRQSAACSSDEGEGSGSSGVTTSKVVALGLAREPGAPWLFNLHLPDCSHLLGQPCNRERSLSPEDSHERCVTI